MKLKSTVLFATLLIFACNQQKKEDTNGNETQVSNDTIKIEQSEESESQKEYSNGRFRNVTVEKLDGDSFKVQGEAQLFEATLNWVVEDGHTQLKKGFETISMGAPEWGKFDFTIHIDNAEVPPVLSLILFEESPKDGSNNYELVIPLK